MTEQVDVLVLGGGAAGLNGALMLARSRRSVLVVDAGTPRNAPADGVHGLLARDGTPPGELLEQGRKEVRRYGGRIREGTASAVVRERGGFTATLADATTVHARRLLVASGLVDELPGIPGLRQRWGRDVLHCPYCHGWEVRDRVIGVLATGPMAMHQALLFRQLSTDVAYLAQDRAPSGDEAEQLAARGIEVVHGEVTAVLTHDDRLTGVRLRDGRTHALEALVVAPRAVASVDALAGIGLRAEEHPSGIGTHLPVDATGRTAVPGVWAAGNVTDPVAQVGTAAAAGAMAGAQINADLVAEETRDAVAVLRAAARQPTAKPTLRTSEGAIST